MVFAGLDGWEAAGEAAGVQRLETLREASWERTRHVRRSIVWWGGGVWQDGCVSEEARLRELLEARAIDAGAAPKLLKCLDLWRFYGRSMNLLGPADRGDALLDHVDEGLAAVEVARACGMAGCPWLDVGSGAGLPGLVVASVRNMGVLELLEPRAKRVSFLRTALGGLGRSDVVVWSGRVEAGRYRGEGRGPRPGSYGVASARAVFDPSVWLDEASCWVSDDGVVLVHLLEDAPVPVGGGAFVVAAEAISGRWRVVGLRRQRST